MHGCVMYTWSLTQVCAFLDVYKPFESCLNLAEAYGKLMLHMQ